MVTWETFPRTCLAMAIDVVRSDTGPEIASKIKASAPIR